MQINPNPNPMNSNPNINPVYSVNNIPNPVYNYSNPFLVSSESKPV